MGEEKHTKDLTLLSERIKVLLKNNGYTIAIPAEATFVDLVYMYKYYRNMPSSLTYMNEFTKWFLSEVKQLHRPGEIKLYIITRLCKTAKYLIDHNRNLRKKNSIHTSSQEETTPSRMQDIQLLVAGIQRAGYNVDPYVYGELAALEAQYTFWLELSDTYIISPNSATLYSHKTNFNPSKETVAVAKSLTGFLEEISGMQREAAIEALAHLKTSTPKNVKEIIRIAKDETVMKRIESSQIPEFVDSIWTLLSNALEIFHPTIIIKPPFLQWFIAQIQVESHQDITQSKVCAIKTHRLKYMIEYDKKAQNQKKEHLPGYPATTSRLIQINSSSQQVILVRIKAVEEEIAEIHKRYEKVEKLLQEKELNGRLQEVEQQKEIEQRKLDLIEERLKKWNTEEVKVNKDILK